MATPTGRSLLRPMLPAALLSLGLATTVHAADVPTHNHNHSATATQPERTAMRPRDVASNMQVMHEKWMAATSPEARQALVAEHMQAMQAGMQAMMNMGHTSETSQRMDMMTLMMQMMMDREGVTAAGKANAASPKP